MANKTKKPIFKLISHFLRAYPLRSFAVLCSLLLAGFVEIIGIGALLPLLNIVLENDVGEPNILSKIISSVFKVLRVEPNIGNLLIIISGAIIFKAFVTYKGMKTVSDSAADITNDFRRKLISALMRAKWQYFSTLPIGKSSNAIATEAELAGQFYTLAGKTFASFLQASIYISIAFLVDWKISLAAVIFGFMAAFVFKYFIRIARSAGQDFTTSLNDLLSRLNESLSGAKALKAMGIEEKFLNLLDGDIKSINIAKKKQAASYLALQAFQEPLLVILIALGLYLTYSYTSYPITELLLVTFLFYRLIGYANMVQSNYQKTIGLESAVNSIFEETKLAENYAEKMNGTLSVTFEKEIAFKNITLGYENHIVCKNLNDVIPAHKITVIFGPSGIGKSTLLDAILGMIKPQSGDVFIDNQNLSQINIKEWRTQIGYVPQDTFLFHDSIFTNIKMGQEDISEKEVIAALQKVTALDFIEKLDDGIHHIVGERGAKLSGGQKQRIALARAIVREPKLLILDEATSGLDKESEKIILDVLKAMLPEMTIIAISHNPKILDIADHVIKLDKQA